MGDTPAVEFLREALAEGAVPVSELERKARKAGLLAEGQSITHAKPFKQAKKILGISSLRTGFGPSGEWHWVLSTAFEADPKETLPERLVPREWINGVARLDCRRPSFGIRLHRWRQFVEDCESFLRSTCNGAARAAALGWDTYALFGSGTANPLAYLGSAGLLWALNGGRIVELHRDWAVVEVAGSESRVTYGRLPAGQIEGWLAWQLEAYCPRESVGGF